ncbi:major facilitator superfamily-domain-containing protein [Podospora australis]|uniref:Efflux pump dotC n=1 Tax=Podospora australis TaxID=1536484 RepID=A0AAN7AJV8_9PEZI|nr:major facilitator superfamily-domain-containing protein [Podospora australis]
MATQLETITATAAPPIAAADNGNLIIELHSLPNADNITKSTIAAPPETTTNPMPPSSETTKPPSPETPQNAAFSTPRSKTLLLAPLCLSVLLSSLDLTIITPAIPTIVSSFSSPSGLIWIGSSFILAHTAVTPLWGSVSDIFGRKPVMLLSQAIFFGASLLCALASNMDMLIVGRALQGVGASGMGMMVNVIICDSFSLRDRGLYLAVTSGVWAVGSAVGPVLGGVFTTELNWRWCFWINLPIGAAVILTLAFFLSIPSPKTPVMSGLKAIDWTGTVLIIGGTLMVLLGLDFGDVFFPWTSATVLCLLMIGSAVLGLFFLNEWKLATNPLFPLRLFSNRSTSAAYGVFGLNAYVFMGLAYYLPLYSQSVLGADALASGVHLVPLIVACSLAAVVAGVVIQKTGRYLPVMYIAQGFLILGVGLFISLDAERNLPKLFGFEILVGIGVGMNMEPPILAAQAAATELDTAAVIATMGFCRSIATAISVVVGGVIFQNEMNSKSHGLVQQLGPEMAEVFSGDKASGAVDLIHELGAEEQVVVRGTYFEALRTVWIMYVAFAGLSLIVNLMIKGHELSKEHKKVVLGVDRGKTEQHEQQRHADESGGRT